MNRICANPKCPNPKFIPSSKYCPNQIYCSDKCNKIMSRSRRNTARVAFDRNYNTVWRRNYRNANIEKSREYSKLYREQHIDRILHTARQRRGETERESARTAARARSAAYAICLDLGLIRIESPTGYCEVCGADISQRRADATSCGPAHRQKLYERRRFAAIRILTQMGVKL
jgi:predicted nucleic acid-binding Zn ribbon protein